MDINKIIQDLLIKNNLVTVPGLGTFSLNYVPAEIYKFSNQVTPPSYQLVFADKVQESDNSLLIEISKNYDLSDIEAQKAIEKWVNEVIFEIDKGSYLLNGVGILKKENNKIVFEADKTSIILADNFGLEITRMPLIEIEGDVIKESLPYNPHYTNASVKKNNWINKILIAVIVIFVGAGIFLLYQMGYMQSGFGKIKALFAAGNKISNVQLATNDTLKGKIDAITLKRNALSYNENKGSNKNDNTKIINNTDQRIMKYYLIAGSFKRMDKAEILKNELSVKGFAPEILAINDSIYRVSLVSFTDRHKAVEEYIMLTAGEFNNKLWLFSQTINE